MDNLTKEQRTERMWHTYPLELSTTESLAEEGATRRRLQHERRLHLLAIIEKERVIGGRTLQEVGDEVGLTRERIRQLQLILKDPEPKERKQRQRISRADERFYRIWRGMVQRTKNKSDINYGGRGIQLCKRWTSYANFEKDMYADYQKHVAANGEYKTTIDRINVNGGYKPSNCRWATMSIQVHNRRSRKDWHFKTTNWGPPKGVKRVTVKVKLHTGTARPNLKATSPGRFT